MDKITLTLDLTLENLEKLKVFCLETGAVPAKKPAAKAKPADKKKDEAPAENASAPVKEEAAQEVKQEDPVQTITKTDVRAVALKLSKAGKSDVLKEIFAKFGATKLSEVPEGCYAELMKELTAANA